MNLTEINKTIVLNEKQAAKRLGIGHSTLRKMRYEKRISFVKIGSRIGYTLKNIEAFIARNSVEA
jgi:excisionase family DNA binding protein